MGHNQRNINKSISRTIENVPNQQWKATFNSIHHLEPKKGWSSLKDAFLKYYSLKTGNKNNNKAATLPSAISSICCRFGQTRLMNDDKSYSRGGSWPHPRHSFDAYFYVTSVPYFIHYCTWRPVLEMSIW